MIGFATLPFLWMIGYATVPSSLRSLLSPNSGLPIPETANAEAQPSTEIGVGSLALD